VASSLGLGHALALLACVLAVVTALLVAFDVPRLVRPRDKNTPAARIEEKTA
jgi:hypothetical protein